MTTLVNSDLFDYISHLEGEVEKRLSAINEGSLQRLMHAQMKRIIRAERNFLEYINANGTAPMLSISPNGLPSVDSLIPDLEKICDLAKDNDSFSEIAQQFRRGGAGKNNSNSYQYIPVSEEEWNKELTARIKEGVQSFVGFSVNQGEDGRFELAVRENVHLKGYDQYCKEFPILTREGKMRYHVVWNRLIDECEESFYVPNTALVVQGRSIKQPERKLFDNIVRHHYFKRKDYRTYSEGMPLLFWSSWLPANYSEFLKAGSEARVRIANCILDALSKSLGRVVQVKGINRKNLKEILDFPTVPFQNAPGTTPQDEDLFSVTKANIYVSTIGESKHPTQFDLVCPIDTEFIGRLEYFLPRRAIRISTGAYGSRYDNGHKFCLGSVRLDVSGTALYNEEQFHQARENLRFMQEK